MSRLNWLTYANHGNRVKRKPLRSFKEMADEFGVTAKQLSGFLLNSEDRPAPKLNHSNGRVNQNSWYDADEMRAWWKNFQDKKNGQ